MRPIAYYLALAAACTAVVVAQGAEPLVVTKVEPYQFKIDGTLGAKVHCAVETDKSRLWVRARISDELFEGWEVVHAELTAAEGDAWISHVREGDEWWEQESREPLWWFTQRMRRVDGTYETGTIHRVEFYIHPRMHGVNRAAAIKRLKAGGIEFHVVKEREWITN